MVEDAPLGVLLERSFSCVEGAVLEEELEEGKEEGRERSFAVP